MVQSQVYTIFKSVKNIIYIYLKTLTYSLDKN